MMRDGKLPPLQQILGHASLAMTMRYAHLAPEHPRSAMLRTERKAEALSRRATDIAPPEDPQDIPEDRSPRIEGAEDVDEDHGIEAGIGKWQELSVGLRHSRPRAMALGALPEQEQHGERQIDADI